MSRKSRQRVRLKGCPFGIADYVPHSHRPTLSSGYGGDEGESWPAMLAGGASHNPRILAHVYASRSTRGGGGDVLSCQITTITELIYFNESMIYQTDIWIRWCRQVSVTALICICLTRNKESVLRCQPGDSCVCQISLRSFNPPLLYSDRTKKHRLVAQNMVVW
jgi:hypothetical protein